MIFGDLVGLKLPDIGLTGEENPEKTSPRIIVPAGDRTQARFVTGAHATACSTAVDYIIFYLILICKLQNVPCAIDFEVKHSIFFCRSFRIRIIIL